MVKRFKMEFQYLMVSVVSMMSSMMIVMMTVTQVKINVESVVISVLSMMTMMSMVIMLMVVVTFNITMLSISHCSSNSSTYDSRCNSILAIVWNVRLVNLIGWKSRLSSGVRRVIACFIVKRML